VVEPIADVVSPVTHVVSPVLDPVAEVVGPVAGILQPVVRPAIETVAPILQPVAEVIDPMGLPITEPVPPAASIVPPGVSVTPPTPGPGGQPAVSPAAPISEPGVSPLTESPVPPVSQSVTQPGSAIDQPIVSVARPTLIPPRTDGAASTGQFAITLSPALSWSSPASVRPSRSYPVVASIAANDQPTVGAPHAPQPRTPGAATVGSQPRVPIAMLPSDPSVVELSAQRGVTVERTGSPRMPWGSVPTFGVDVHHAHLAVAAPSSPELWPAASSSELRSFPDAAAGRRLPPGVPRPLGSAGELGSGMGASSLTSSGASDHPDGALADSLVRIALNRRVLWQQMAPIRAGYVPDVPVPPGRVQSS
jgi:hypothetical protein